MITISDLGFNMTEPLLSLLLIWVRMCLEARYHVRSQQAKSPLKPSQKCLQYTDPKMTMKYTFKNPGDPRAWPGMGCQSLSRAVEEGAGTHRGVLVD